MKGRAGYEAGRVKDLLYSSLRGSNATGGGGNNSSPTHDMHSTRYMDLKTIKTGLVDRAKNPWLAANPDDWVYDPLSHRTTWASRIYEPRGAHNVSIRQAASTISHFCIGLTNYDTLDLKHSHDYYYQIQIAIY